MFLATIGTKATKAINKDIQHMSTIGVCHVCHGAKTIMGMGMIYKSCHHCDGVGYISVAEPAKPTVVTIGATEHDIGDMPPKSASKPRLTVSEKRKAWRDKRKNQTIVQA